MARRSAKFLAAVAASAICGSALAQIPPSLPAASSVAGTDLFNVWQTNTTRTASSTQIVASGLSSGLNETPVGNTTPSTGAFTTLSASGAVSGAGFTSLFGSPPSIGSTAPGTGAFTTLSATSAVSGAGITSLFASPPSIGSTAAGSGSFTTLAASGAVSGTGFLNFLASPTSIGSVTPSTGSFTTLSASSTVSGTGITARFSSPGPIGNTVASTGAFTTLSATGLITPSSTVGIQGTTTNDIVQVGSIGEYYTPAPIPCTTNTGYTSGTTVNIASQALTAGDWEVDGTAGVFLSVSSALTSIQVGMSTASGGFDQSLGALGRAFWGYIGNTANQTMPTGSRRISISSPTTVYLVLQANFSSGTAGICGQMEARRVR